jgi:hypothetical protein
MSMTFGTNVLYEVSHINPNIVHKCKVVESRLNLCPCAPPRHHHHRDPITSKCLIDPPHQVTLPSHDLKHVLGSMQPILHQGRKYTSASAPQCIRSPSPPCMKSLRSRSPHVIMSTINHLQPTSQQAYKSRPQGPCKMPQPSM